MTNKERIIAHNNLIDRAINKANSLPNAGGSTNPTAKYNEVNFYDYDGTILYSYTVEEAQALTELPPLPTQPGLICQGWNYDLETIKSYNRAVDVGATYITDDGKTRLYIKLVVEVKKTISLSFSQTVTNGVIIDWGDGSYVETVSGVGRVNVTHSYLNTGDYVISLDVVSNCFLSSTSGQFFALGGNALQRVELGTNVAGIDTMFWNCYNIVSATISRGVTSIDYLAFQGCTSLTSITIPDSVTSIGEQAFEGCIGLASITIPDSVTSIGNLAFNNCTGLTNMTIPNSITNIESAAFANCMNLTNIIVSDEITSINSEMFENNHRLTNVIIPRCITSIGSEAFKGCTSLTSITIPDSVTSIGEQAFEGCRDMQIYDFTLHTSVPTLSTINVFNNISSDCIIKVPASLYGEWITATNWSVYANQIVDEFGNQPSAPSGEIIEFSIEGFKSSYSCQATKGMTWIEWCDSEYNTAGLYVEEQMVTNGMEYLSHGDYEETSPYAVIIANYTYELVM